MFKPKLSYANVAATLALVFSMTGGAMAAHHYLITSTKQISPKVVKALKGKTGKTGPAGPQGPAGSPGAPGAPGQNLTAQTTLPSGQSESGAFSAGGGFDPTSGGEGYLGAGITYVQPLAKAIPDENIIDVKGTSAPHCPGRGKADPNYLCLYNTISFNVEEGYGYSSDAEVGPLTPSPGVVLYWYTTGRDPYVGGIYTVTAP
jgi:hypothetical protein